MSEISPAFATAPAQIPRIRRFKTARVIFALMMREVASTDGRTSLGFLWSFLEPIATIFLLTFMFQFLTRTPPLGTNFALFYATGILPYSLFVSAYSKSAQAFRFSRQLLSFPVVRPLDAILARFLLHLFVSSLVFVITISLILEYYQISPIIRPELVVASLALAASLGLAVGTFNSVLFLMFPAYANVYGVISRPLMLFSGVLILPDELPRPYGEWLWWNPVIHPVEMMRSAFYTGYDPDGLSPLYALFVAMPLFTLGLVTMHRTIRDALEK